MSFFTEDDFPGFEKPISIEHSIHHALLANEKVAPLVEELARLVAECSRLREALELALSFAPTAIAPKGSDPTFYHTLSYEGDCALLERLNKARAALAGEKKE